MRYVTSRSDAPHDRSGAAFVWESHTIRLAGFGQAVRIPVAVAARTLAALEGDDGDGIGEGPIAFGALPFTGARNAEVVLPSFVVGERADGTRWTTSIDGSTRPDRVHSEAEPDAFSLVAVQPHSEFMLTVQKAVDAIRAGRVRKVVLAREVTVEANRPISVDGVLRRLRSLYPSCFLYSMDSFVGASPELLIARHGASVRSHPLAGTAARTGDPTNDARLQAELEVSPKVAEEHRYVVEDVVATLTAAGVHVEPPSGPTVVPLRNVLHLGTEISGSGGTEDALQMALRLHPTAAVGGTPRVEALALIEELEGYDRGRYAGPVGWVDGAGDGEWAVGIRCADVHRAHARLVSGVGIVAGSDPESELAETQLKLQALLAALVRP